MTDKRLYYLCHPYSSIGEKKLNLIKSIKLTNLLLDKGYFILNPLTHSHYLDVVKAREYDFWIDFDLKMLERCDYIILCEGYKDSKGCMLELKKAKELGLGIVELKVLL